MTEKPAPQTTVIQLWEPRTDCAMCGADTPLNWSVAWFCGPVHVEIGEQVPGWKGEAIAGGMPVCKTCHDAHYGEDADAA